MSHPIETPEDAITQEDMSGGSLPPPPRRLWNACKSTRPLDTYTLTRNSLRIDILQRRLGSDPGPQPKGLSSPAPPATQSKILLPALLRRLQRCRLSRFCEDGTHESKVLVVSEFRGLYGSSSASGQERTRIMEAHDSPAELPPNPVVRLKEKQYVGTDDRYPETPTYRLNARYRSPYRTTP